MNQPTKKWSSDDRLELIARASWKIQEEIRKPGREMRIVNDLAETIGLLAGKSKGFLEANREKILEIVKGEL